MREGLPSVTAAIVALGRGVASAYPMVRPPLHDDAARSLLPPLVSWLIPAPERAYARLSQAVLRVASAGLVDQMALRSSAIDDSLRNALREGVKQVVILGAGLDARAYRLRELAAATVFEVDHPATQRYKLAKLAALRPVAGHVTHVAIDFARGASLANALSGAQHDRDAPTFWIWEGVTMYLTREQTRRTIDVVGARSARGSALAATYMIPNAVPLPAALRRVVDATMSVIGEPLDGAISPDDLRDLLRAAGLEVASDESSREWQAGFGGSARLARLFAGERLVVARRSVAT